MKIGQVLSFVALWGFLPTVTATLDSLLDDTCAYNTYMCCWTKNDGDGMVDNTDVCRVLDSDDVGDTREFPGDSEGEVHCHGFVSADGANLDAFIKPLYKYVRNYDHRDARGYYGRCVRKSNNTAVVGGALRSHAGHFFVFLLIVWSLKK